MIKLLASYNDELANVVIKNAACNAKYISHSIQQQIMQIMFIELERFNFFIIFHESCDESLREHMSTILMFVDKNGCTPFTIF